MATTAANPKLVAARPAESLTIAGAIAFLIARSLGVDNDTTLTAMTMVIAFTPAAITWLVELFSRGRAETSETPGEAETPQTPRDTVAEELRDLNKTIREAIASKPPGEPKESAVGSDFVDAVERVLAAREAEREKRETMSDLVRDTMSDLMRTLVDELRRASAKQREVRPASRASGKSTG